MTAELGLDEQATAHSTNALTIWLSLHGGEKPLATNQAENK